MSETIDWMAPVQARPVQPIYGPRSGRSARPSLSGIREEQLRRAAILQKAANGPKITKGNATAVVERLARVVPGMRYKVGVLVSATLAPPAPALMASRGDDLPGRQAGRPPKWTPESRALLVEWVDKRMTAAGETAAAAVIAYGDKLAAAGMYPPSAKTLANQLARGRREASDG